MDGKTRKLLVQYKALHPESNATRVYIWRKEGNINEITVANEEEQDGHKIEEEEEYKKRIEEGRKEEKV